MKLSFFVVVLFGLSLVSALPVPSFKTTPNVKFIPHEYIILFRNGVSEDLVSQHRAWIEASLDADSKIHRFYSIGKSFRAYSGTFSQNLLRKIHDREGVEAVVQNSEFELYGVQREAPWGLDRVHQRDLPLDTLYVYPDSAGEGVNVYVVDTGVRITHEDFEGRAIWGVTTPRDSIDTDLNGHGTHVASTIAGKTYGIAKKATIIAVKVMKDSGLGTVFDITDGLDWVAEQHRTGTNKKSVVNMSLGSPIPNFIIDRATVALIEEGVHTVVAAGNSERDACNTSPAGVPEAITTGATDEFDAMSYFSNFGPCVDVFSPGSNITAAWYDGDSSIITISGTSMASPHTAGVVALLLAEADYTTAQMHAKIIEVSSKDKLRGLPEGSENRLLFNDFE